MSSPRGAHSWPWHAEPADTALPNRSPASGIFSSAHSTSKNSALEILACKTVHRVPLLKNKPEPGKIKSLVSCSLFMQTTRPVSQASLSFDINSKWKVKQTSLVSKLFAKKKRQVKHRNGQMQLMNSELLVTTRSNNSSNHRRPQPFKNRQWDQETGWNGETENRSER